MLLFRRTLHVMSLGLWFGMAVFFTFVVGLSLFDTFSSLSETPASSRPYWFPPPAELERNPPSPQFPNPLRKEQGSRLAGEALGPMFIWYYSLQLACGILVLVTALGWVIFPGKVHKVRLALVLLAFAGAGLGWWMERKVHDYRTERNRASDVVLTTAMPSSDAIREADEARKKFGQWHGYSLIANFFTLAMVTGAMVLAGKMPSDRDPLPTRSA